MNFQEQIRDFQEQLTGLQMQKKALLLQKKALLLQKTTVKRWFRQTKRQTKRPLPGGFMESNPSGQQATEAWSAWHNIRRTHHARTSVTVMRRWDAPTETASTSVDCPDNMHVFRKATSGLWS